MPMLAMRVVLPKGGIAQLAEHELCKLGVTGSNPVASTMLRQECETRRGRAVKSCGRPDLNGTRGAGVVRSCTSQVSGRVAQLVRARP